MPMNQLLVTISLQGSSKCNQVAHLCLKPMEIRCPCLGCIDGVCVDGVTLDKGVGIEREMHHI